MEADVFPLHAPERSIVIDAAIGELSLFHQTLGYYAHGVDPTTAVLPDGWESRLIRIENQNTMGAIGWCLDANDLAFSKLAAGRERDLNVVRIRFQNQLASIDVIRERVQASVHLAAAMRETILHRAESIAR